MTNQQILEKAIQKAIDSGWTVNNWTDCDDFEWEIEPAEYEGDYPSMRGTGMGEEWWIGIGNLILMHDFAKALWGTFKRTATVSRTGRRLVTVENKGYKHHLQQMVIAEDPIKYLGKNL